MAISQYQVHKLRTWKCELGKSGLPSTNFRGSEDGPAIGTAADVVTTSALLTATRPHVGIYYWTKTNFRCDGFPVSVTYKSKQII